MLWLFFLLVISNTQVFFLDNIYLSVTQDIISVTSRARNGYFYLGISNNNSSFENGIALIVTNSNSALDFVFYQGGSDKNLSRTNISQPLEVKKILDLSGFFFGRFLDDLSFQIEVNKTAYQNKFPLPFYVFVGYNKNSKPKSPNDFEEKFEESAWLKIPDYHYRAQALVAPLLRIETIHPAVFAFVIFYHLVFALLAIIFSKYQPLKSRGILPILIPLVLIIEVFCDVFTFLPFKIQQGYIFINYFIRYPIILAIITIYNVQFIKLLLLFYMNERKQIIFFQKNKPTSMNYRFQFLKYMGKFYVFAPLFFIFYIFYVIVIVIVYFIEITIKINIVGLTTILITLFLFLTSSIIYLYDLVKNFNSFKTCKAYTDDNLFWRIEFYVLGAINYLIFFVGITVCLYFIIFNPNGLYLLFLFAMTIFHHEMLFSNTLFLLFITIFKVFLSCFKKKKLESELVQILDNETSKEYFIQFAKSEFSIENVLCYYDLKKYQNETKEDIRATLAQEIYDNYLKGTSSELEVNLITSSCRKVEHLIQLKSFNPDLFQEIYTQIISNLSDTYHRFIFSDSYKKLLNVKVLFKEIN